MKYLRRSAVVLLLPVFISACSSGLSVRPFAPIPATCAAIDAEMAEIGKTVASVGMAKKAKGVAMMALSAVVGAAILGPGYLAALPVMEAASIDLQGHEDRLKVLQMGRMFKQELGKC